MIDFNKIQEAEIEELKRVAAKAVEKSEFEKIFLFTQNLTEKSKLFLFSWRFLMNVYNLIEDGDLRTALKDELQNTSKIYSKLSEISQLTANFGKHRRLSTVSELTDSKEAMEVIDLFSILVERVNIIKISRLKGILLEGKSGEEYKKLFNVEPSKEYTEVST